MRLIPTLPAPGIWKWLEKNSRGEDLTSLSRALFHFQLRERLNFERWKTKDSLFGEAEKDNYHREPSALQIATCLILTISMR